MINYLCDKLSGIVSRLQTDKLTESKIEGILHDIKIALLDSDVNYKITIDFIRNVKNEIANDKTVIKHKKYRNQFVLQVLKKRMIEILDNHDYELNYTKKPAFFMFVGLQGGGKTTTVAKIAQYYKNKFNSKILVVACDIHRPAASIQLSKLCKSISVPVIKIEKTKKLSAIEIAKKGINIGIRDKYDLVLFDTAGRTINDKKMITEILRLNKVIKPVESIFVVDAMAGQGILETANFFKEKLNLTSAILTKFDSESRSGSAFTLAYQTKIPIVFVGVGEKVSDLDKYYPKRIVKQILGMGDLETLLEKTEKAFSLEASEGAFKQFMSGTLSLDSMIKQMEGFTKLGPLKSITRMIPGLPKLPQRSEEKMKWQLKIMRSISNSATPEERKTPVLLQEMTRKIRILKGSGVKGNEYNKFLKLFKDFNSHSASIRQLIQNVK